MLKVGKAWRVPRPALEDFLRRGMRPQTLVGHLQAFLTVPDHVIGVATTLDLLHRFAAAFLEGEMAGGRSLWAAFDRAEDVGLDTALRQQRELREVVHERPATLGTGVLERVREDWSLGDQRCASHAHHGLVSLSATYAFLVRSVSLPRLTSHERYRRAPARSILATQRHYRDI